MGDPRWRRLDLLVPAWLAVTLVIWGARGFHNALSRDPALYVYAGQEVADGLPPYVGVMNRAGPLAHLLPGLGVWLGRLSGAGDVVGARAVYFLLAALAPALVYLVGRTLLASRPAGCVAAAAMLGFQGFAAVATNGPHSKQPMVMLVALALLLAARDRLLLCGLATGLATLTWQPALFALAPAALVVALARPGGWRPRLKALGGYLAGGAATLIAMVGYFAAAGALDAFYEGFWEANARFTEQPGLLDQPERIWPLLLQLHGWTIWLVVGGLVLLLVLPPATLLRRRRGRTPVTAAEVSQAALAAGAVGGLAWSVRAFNGAPDSFVLLPFAALGLGAGAAALAAGVARLPVAARVPARRALVGSLVAGVVATALLTLQLTSSARTDDLDADRALARSVFANLPDDATVLSAHAPQPLVLSGERSISRFQIYGNGMRSYIASLWPHGLKQYVAWVRDQAPSVVVTSPRGFLRFMRPVGRHYVLVGAGHGWLVYLHEDIDPGTRNRVSMALAEGVAAPSVQAG